MAKTMLDKTDTMKAVSEEWDAENEVLTITFSRRKMLEIATESNVNTWTDKEGRDWFFFPDYGHQASGIRISRNGAIGVSLDLPKAVSKVPENVANLLANMSAKDLEALVKSLKK